MNARVIVYHKQSTSARTRFVRLESNTVCCFEPVTPPADLIDLAEDDPIPDSAAILADAAGKLGLEASGLEATEGFNQRLETPAGEIQIFLARCTAIDPPFEAVENRGGRFIAITEARDLPAHELNLLRNAYELIMGS